MLIKKFTFILGKYSMRKARYLTARYLFLFVIMYNVYTVRVPFNDNWLLHVVRFEGDGGPLLHYHLNM